MPREKAPTERDRYWMDHSKALAASGKTAKEYARDEGLSVHALYQSRKRLRKLGLLEPSADSGAPKKPPGFSRVVVQSPERLGAEFRLRFPNGLVFEWSGDRLPAAVTELLERLVSGR